MLVGGIVTNIGLALFLKLFFVCWDHGATRWFFSLQPTNVLIQVKILANFGFFEASIENQDEIHSGGPAPKTYAHDILLPEDENTSMDFHSIAKLWAQEDHYSSELSSFGTEEVLNPCLEAQSWNCEIHPSVHCIKKVEFLNEMLKIEDFMNPELEKLCPISEHSLLWGGSACQQLSNRSLKCSLKIWRKLSPSWENQIISFERTPSKAVSCEYLMTEYYVVVFFVNVRGFLPRLATLLVPSKIMCLCTHIVLIFPYHVAKEEIWRYHFCQSFITFIGYHCPAFANKDIQCLERSLWNHPLACSFFIPLAMGNIMYSLR